ncbi:MAG: SixA phosphatase family protein [Acidimicrobiales bacterium]
MTVYLVRHAHAVGRGRWDGDDLQRPLSALGHRQTAGLVKLLGGEPIRRILSSPAVRCVDSVTPLAGELGHRVKHRSELLEGEPRPPAFELLRGAAGRKGDSVACCHGDLVPEVLRWVSAMGARLEGGDRWTKGSTWCLDWEGDRFVRGRYLPPVEA